MKTELNININNMDASAEQLTIAETIINSCNVHAGDVFLNRLYNQIIYALRKNLNTDKLYETTMYTYNSTGQQFNICIDFTKREVIKKELY